LRRLKSEVEKQLPPKHEHVVRCKLSKRQRYLYEEFMSHSDTKETLASGNFLGIVNVLMQLRKVCNHPDLFEVRPIVSPFDVDRIRYDVPSLASRALDVEPLESLDLDLLGLLFTKKEGKFASYEADRIIQLRPTAVHLTELSTTYYNKGQSTYSHPLDASKRLYEERLEKQKRANLEHSFYINELRTQYSPVYGRNLINTLSLEMIPRDIHTISKDPKRYMDYSSTLKDMIKLPERRVEEMKTILENYVCTIPRARAPPIELHCCHPNPSKVIENNRFLDDLVRLVSPLVDIYRIPFVRTQLYFPDKRLIQYDCGKLQTLAELLRYLKAEGHRCLIFTQMTKMLDVLEIFLNIHGYTYLRLDGTTKVEKRQMLMEKYNKDKRIFLFILSTRSGGIGVNLTGADTVIFYDSDWNPAMDAQVIVSFL
jgi:SNF2 family DNA or RNA helicase